MHENNNRRLGQIVPFHSKYCRDYEAKQHYEHDLMDFAFDESHMHAHRSPRLDRIHFFHSMLQLDSYKQRERLSDWKVAVEEASRSIFWLVLCIVCHAKGNHRRAQLDSDLSVILAVTIRIVEYNLNHHRSLLS